MASSIVVQIMAERIMNRGLNPKTGEIYVIEDITNEDYRKAVEFYISKHAVGA